MNKRGIILGFGVLVLVVGAVAGLARWSREPSCGGRTLTNWLQQICDTRQSETRQIAEAQAAVRAIGAERAAPVLLRLFQAQDGPLRSWVSKIQELWGFHLLKLRDAEDRQQFGFAGFEVLGTNCAPVVPDLARTLEDTNRAFMAVRCLSAIGKPAEFALRQSLTNQDRHVREWGIAALAGIIDNPEDLIGCVKGLLDDPDGSVRMAALRVVGHQTKAPDAAIRLLVAALETKTETFAAAAAAQLAGFGTNGLQAFNALTNAAETGRPAVASQALRTLARLAPKPALDIMLDWLRSPDPQRQRAAMALLRSYPVMAPEIRAGLESAATGPDARVSQLAREVLANPNQRRRAGERMIPNEAAYRSQPLAPTNTPGKIGPTAAASP